MIILVDDETDNRELAEYLLKAAGFDVLAFHSGEPALEHLNRCGKDCNIEAVLLDLSLPTLDGLTIAEQIRLNETAFDRQPVPIAFYTGHQQMSGGATERVAAKTNVEKIFHKPQDTPKLAHLIKDWLLSREIQNQPCEENDDAI